ncbi:protein lethal(2)essential for life-like [Cylas formicarius]|uniref:protein lethal(2)essential for life-like n=1 Tax=Cylas formicarius TaxID=197179 RepID=UPI0029586847|nr:protein lethal(2)essential for life-like [Cylas formicarius]
MSFIPILVRDMMRPLRMMENQMRMIEDELFRPSSAIWANRPRYALKYPDQSSDLAVTQDKQKFQVRLDVENFKPDEIKVKTVNDNVIEIEAKHEEKKDDHGFISRHFVRRFVLPKGHNLKEVVSSLSEDGILTVTAPKQNPEIQQEKAIPVEHISDK